MVGENDTDVNALPSIPTCPQIGKIDEIFGTIREYHVSVKLSEGMKAKSFEKDKQLFIDPAKLLPLSRYLVVE